jgi:hypothetical protein
MLSVNNTFSFALLRISFLNRYVMIFFKYYIIVLLSVFSACNFNPDKQIVPAWSMDFLGPLVKAEINIQNINELADIHAVKRLTLSDLYSGPTTGSVTIPPFVSPTLGPFGLNLTNAFGSAEIKSGDLYYTITDSLQVNVISCDILIQQGATTLLSNSTGPIAKNGGVYISPITNLANMTLNSTINLTIKNFSSGGSGGVVTIDPGRKLIIEIYLKNVRVKTIYINGINSFSLADTSVFSIKGSNIPSQSVSGTFTAFFKNNIPLNFDLQVYFLDESQTQVLDSLFDNPNNILAGNAASQEVKLVTQVNNTKIDHLNNSSFALTQLTLSNATNSTIPDSLFLKMQIVGDLQIRLNK